MSAALRETLKSLGRPVKRAIEAVIDDRLVNYRMPKALPGDLLITFDDGPHPGNTPEVLDLLDQYNARAVFFIIGERAEKYPDLVKAYHDRGHVVANHTYSHLNAGKGGRYTRAEVVDDITRCNRLVTQITGQQTQLFRPPRGELNTKTLNAARESAHRLMLWSIEGGEWGRRSEWSGQDIGACLISKTKKRDILLLHDDNKKSLTALAALLPSLAAKDFDLRSAVDALKG